MKNSFLLLGLVIVFFFGCKKDNNDLTTDQNINSWTFTAEGTVYKGELYFDAILNTLLQGNDSYTFSMLGGEASSDRVFNIVMSLADTTFKVKQYESGIRGNMYINSFFFTHGIAGAKIYESTNYSPGPVMKFTVESYDPVTKRLVISFSGNASSASGNYIPITNGKVICKVDKV